MAQGRPPDRRPRRNCRPWFGRWLGRGRHPRRGCRSEGRRGRAWGVRFASEKGEEDLVTWKAAPEPSAEAKPEPVGKARGIGPVSLEVVKEALNQARTPARSDAHEEPNAGAYTGKACCEPVVRRES